MGIVDFAVEGSEDCLQYFVNHSSKRPNAVFQVMQGWAGRTVALLSLTEIGKDEEILTSET